MATPIQHFDVSDHAGRVRSDGFTLVRSVIPPDECEPIGRRLMDVAGAHRDEDAYADGVSFVPCVINHDQSFAAYLADQRVIALAQALLGPNVRISFTSAIINEPGKKRSHWHADWPFNQNNAGHLPAPYPDVVMHLTSLLMVTAFTQDNGGTLIVPGSHRYPNNPSDKTLGIDQNATHPNEYRVTGDAGDMVIFDSRTWHCPPANPSQGTRIAIALRYAPWWLNLEILDPDSDYRRQLVDESGKTDNIVPRVEPQVYEALPDHVKPLYRHWLRRDVGATV